MADHDGSYKLLFSQPRMVEDLLRGFVREPWVLELDLSTLEKVNPSYVTDDLRHREDDLVWRVRRGGGAWIYVYLLFEFQSTVDPFMAVRLLSYVGLLYQDLVRRGELTRNRKLPPVLPVVLYNGARRWRAARSLERLIEPVSGGLDAYLPRLRYLLLDERRYPESGLEGPRNVVAALFRLERSRRPEEVRAVVSALVEWLPEPGDTELRRALAAWLMRVLLPARAAGAEVPEVEDLREVKTMLRETVIDWTRDWKEKGRKEGEIELLVRQMQRRFGPLDEGVRARLEAATAHQLLRWGERLIEAGSLEEVFGRRKPTRATAPVPGS